MGWEGRCEGGYKLVMQHLDRDMIFKEEQN